MTRLDTRDPNFAAAFAAILSRSAETTAGVAETVAAIIADVRARGDAAIRDYTTRFDRHTIDSLALDTSVPPIAPDLAHALAHAAARIEAFHRAQLPADLRIADSGLTLGLRWTPLDAVGLYVPGGKASYPSSVLMNAIPARVAGVSRIALCVPTPDGVVNPLVLAAARLAGVTELYRIGGAQAVAALAFGTQTIAPVDRVVGPGNAYVAEAKRQVFGHVGIDSIAGPSEVLILAGPPTDPRHVAIDLLAQAEHDEAAQCVLIATDAAYIDAVLAALNDLLPTLPRRAIAAASWAANGAVILARDWPEAADLANQVAAEHLQIMLPDPHPVFARIRHAGAAFLNAPTALGDYIAGPNHVLPTGRTARFASGLSVFDFLKRTTWVEAHDLSATAPDAALLAEAEGLTAHAVSLTARNSLSPPGRGPG